MIMPKIEVAVSASGMGTVKIDGVDVSNCTGVNIRIRPQELTRIIVMLYGDVNVTAAGEVRKVQAA